MFDPLLIVAVAALLWGAAAIVLRHSLLGDEAPVYPVRPRVHPVVAVSHGRHRKTTGVTHV
jgi:hypothetical protein